MILWHLGVAVLVVYLTLGRRRIDYRFIMLGGVAPDVIDPLLGLFLFQGDSGRWIAHSMLGPVAVSLLIILALRGEQRLAWFGLGVGWLVHLVADGMWEAPRTFLWPAFGISFAQEPREPYSWDLFVHPLDHLGTWGLELLGLAILAWFWVAFELGKDNRASLFLKDGYLRP